MIGLQRGALQGLESGHLAPDRIPARQQIAQVEPPVGARSAFASYYLFGFVGRSDPGIWNDGSLRIEHQPCMVPV